MIKVPGFRVAHAKLGSMLLCHPQAKDVTVAGRSTQKTEELSSAFVVTNGNKNLERELLKWVEERVARYKCLEGEDPQKCVQGQL